MSFPEGKIFPKKEDLKRILTTDISKLSVDEQTIALNISAFCDKTVCENFVDSAGNKASYRL